MMRLRKTKQTGLSQANGSVGGCNPDAVDWEMRPGGMLVQKRLDTDNNSSPAAPTIRVRVKHSSTYHEITISSQATFGELKKKLAEPTGIHHQDQKIFFKDKEKERDSKAYLDISGVKDKSKLVVVEDPFSQEKRYLELRKNAKMDRAAKSISDISLEIDKLAGQVSALESVISKGGKVSEKDVVNLIELLMDELIKLDVIVADGDVKFQRKMQVRRVQKYVETLDLLKITNSMATSTGDEPHNNNSSDQNQLQQRHLNRQQKVPQPSSPSPMDNHHQPRNSIGHSPLRQKSPQPQPQQQKHMRSACGTVVTTQWEVFDSTFTSTSASTSSLNNPNSSPFPAPLPSPSNSVPDFNNQKLIWDLLL